MLYETKKILRIPLLCFLLIISYSCGEISIDPKTKKDDVESLAQDKNLGSEAKKEISLNAEEQKVADRLLQNEEFKNWIKLNDDFSKSVLQTLKGLSKEKSKDLITNYKSSKDSEE